MMKKMMAEGCSKLSIPISDKQLEQLCVYTDLLLEWNSKMNLTTITEPNEIVTKHFLDSMTAIAAGNVSGSVIDVGTGAGFPGMVLKIMLPDIKLTLLDSLNKRLTFLRTVAETLHIQDIDFVHARAEDAGQNAQYRAKFDTVVSRAVANMTTLSELCLPFLRTGGRFLALKGPLAESEVTDAKRAITILGGELDGIFETKIPFTDLSHKIVVIKKVRQTPMKYPRKAGIPTKTPLNTCYNLKKDGRI